MSTDPGLRIDHILFFDNATTHTKRPEGSLSARHMPKKTSSPEKNWGVEVTDRDANGKPIYRSDDKPLKKKINMQDGRFADGSPQPLYFESGPHAGLFKGMAIILEERGLMAESKLRAECKKFKCPSDSESPTGTPVCCCRRVLYSQPDFVQVDSILETVCQARGYKIIFLPKFHCELNFIEQCWGYAKRIYRHYPPSSKEADLTKNVVSALESIPLISMRRFATRSCRFADAYKHGLTGKQAAWARKTYRGHRIMPKTLLHDLDKAGLT